MQTDIVSVCVCSHPLAHSHKCPQWPGLGCGQSWKLGTQSRPLLCIAATHVYSVYHCCLVQYVLAESWTQERSQDLNAGIRDASVPRSILLAGPDDSFWLFLIKLNSSDDILCLFVYFVPLIVYPMLRPSVCPSNNPSQLSSLCVYEWLLLHVHFVYKETVDSNSIFHQQAVSLSSTSSLRLRGLSHEA